MTGGTQHASRRTARRIRESLKTYGLAQTFHDLLVRGVNRVTLLKILRGVTIERADPAFLVCPEPYRPMFLPEAMLRRFGADPANELPSSFLDDALARGDECYGILEGESLAAYGWYARRPTRIEPPELVLRFSDAYVYMYKGFTHVKHRGRRLHAIGMTRALQHYLDGGSKGLVSYVESNNFASLRSVFRMGYTPFGSIWVWRILGRTLAWTTPGCRAYGFRIETVEEQPSCATAPL